MSIGTFSGCKVRIMPDVHAGAGCVIGFTGDLGDKVIPNIVGVDIGCGMLVQPFDCSGEIDFHALNEFILNNIPSGRGIRDKAELVLPQPYMERYGEARELIKALRCFRDLKDSKRLGCTRPPVRWAAAITSSSWTMMTAAGCTSWYTPAAAIWASRWPKSTRNWR